MCKPHPANNPRHSPKFFLFRTVFATIYVSDEDIFLASPPSQSTHRLASPVTHFLPINYVISQFNMFRNPSILEEQPHYMTTLTMQQPFVQLKHSSIAHHEQSNHQQLQQQPVAQLGQPTVEEFNALSVLPSQPHSTNAGAPTCKPHYNTLCILALLKLYKSINLLPSPIQQA